MSTSFDIIVIGGGPAGYSSAIHAARQLPPGSVALVEPLELGGTCLNRGCIPTKTLIETAGFLDAFAVAPQRGIVLTGSAAVDIPKAFQYKNRVVKKMATGIAVLLRENGIERLTGTASVRRNGSAFIVDVSKSDGGTEPYTARKIILATGSGPTRISVPGMDSPELVGRILDSDDMLEADQLPGGVPERLAILGGGVIGIEMARIFKAFGSEVHIIEALPHLAPFLDAEVSEALTKTLKSKKIKISTGTTLERIEAVEAGLRLHLGAGEPIDATHLLVAVGRSPKTDALSADLLQSLEPDRRGFLLVDEMMRTKIAGLFAPGDVNGRCMLAHAAIEMGRLAAESAVEELSAGDSDRPGSVEAIESFLEEYRRRIMEKGGNDPCFGTSEGFSSFYVPGCIYGDPEVGFIGLTEAVAREKLGDRIAVGRFPFAANGRAASAGHRDGFVKVICRKDDSRVIGVHIVGPCASELINEVAVLLRLGGSIEQWIASIHGHPTYGEAIVEAAADSLGIALHLPPK